MHTFAFENLPTPYPIRLQLASSARSIGCFLGISPRRPVRVSDSVAPRSLAGTRRKFQQRSDARDRIPPTERRNNTTLQRSVGRHKSPSCTMTGLQDPVPLLLEAQGSRVISRAVPRFSFRAYNERAIERVGFRKPYQRLNVSHCIEHCNDTLCMRKGMVNRPRGIYAELGVL